MIVSEYSDYGMRMESTDLWRRIDGVKDVERKIKLLRRRCQHCKGEYPDAAQCLRAQCMAIQESAHVYVTDFLREAEWADKVRDQGAYDIDC